jgi:hypothetical protein
MRAIAMALGLVALGSAAGGPAALGVLPVQAAPNIGQRVTFSGCVFTGTPDTCLMIKSPEGTLYNVNAITPRPRALDRVIRVRGTITDKASACSQGIVLDRIRWSRTRQRCAN